MPDDVPMTWRMPSWLRWGITTAVGLACSLAALGLGASSPSMGDIILAIVAAVLASVLLVIPAWRGLIAVDGDTLTVRAGLRATRRIQRDEITRIVASNYGVFIEYLRAGRTRSLIAEAAQGGLNLLGARVLRRSARSEEIAQCLKAWWQGPENAEAGRMSS